MSLNSGNPDLGARTPVPTSKPPSVWRQAAVLTSSFVVLLYVVELADALSGQRLQRAGIEPRSLDGLWGVAFAPMLHDDWAHLIANTLPVLVLGYLVLVSGIGRGLAATAVIWVFGGVGTWLFAGSGEIHMGASVLVFGWVTYLVVRGFFTRSVGHVLIGVVVLVIYGGVLWGVLPSVPGVSWQGHLFGAIGGILAASVVSRREREARALSSAMSRTSRL